MILGEFLFGAIGSEDAIGLVNGRLEDWERPETIVHAMAFNDSFIVFCDGDIVFGENSDAVIVAELGERDEGSSLEVIQYMSMLRSRRKFIREW